MCFRAFQREFDSRAVRIPLTAAQELLDTAGADLLVTTLHRTEDTDTAHHAISALLKDSKLEARHWRALSDFYEKTLTLYERQFGILQAIILLMVLLSVANSVNMTAFERLSEFGTMLALGNQNRHIFRLIVTKSDAWFVRQLAWGGDRYRRRNGCVEIDFHAPASQLKCGLHGHDTHRPPPLLSAFPDRFVATLCWHLFCLPSASRPYLWQPCFAKALDHVHH